MITLLSALGGGLFLIPLLTLAGAVVFGYQAYKASKSGSTITDQFGTKESDENVPLWNIGQFWFSVALVVATIVITIMMIGDK